MPLDGLSGTLWVSGVHEDQAIGWVGELAGEAGIGGKTVVEEGAELVSFDK